MRLKIKLEHLCIVFFIVVLFIQHAYAAEIHLKDGTVINGDIVEQTADYITLNISGVSITYYADQLADPMPDKPGEALKTAKIKVVDPEGNEHSLDMSIKDDRKKYMDLMHAMEDQIKALEATRDRAVNLEQTERGQQVVLARLEQRKKDVEKNTHILERSDPFNKLGSRDIEKERQKVDETLKGIKKEWDILSKGNGQEKVEFIREITIKILEIQNQRAQTSVAISPNEAKISEVKGSGESHRPDGVSKDPDIEQIEQCAAEIKRLKGGGAVNPRFSCGTNL